MSLAVLDASAVLALVLDEPGTDLVREVISDAVISSVNWAEVAQRVSVHGGDIALIRDALQAGGLRIEPLSMEAAELAGTLAQGTKKLGLSLADRCCLSTGVSLGLPVYTADRTWLKVKLDLDLKVIR